MPSVPPDPALPPGRPVLRLVHCTGRLAPDHAGDSTGITEPRDEWVARMHLLLDLVAEDAR